MVAQHYKAYSAAMQTMAGTRQVVMLYDGIIRFLQQARDAMQERRIQQRYNNLTRASEIVFGLQSCLDFERGGEVARTLYNFYATVDARIFALHFNNDASVCDGVIEDVRRMRDAWIEVDRTTGQPADSGAQGGTAAPQGKPDSGDGVAVSA